MSDKDESRSQTLGDDGNQNRGSSLTTSQDETTEDGHQNNLDGTVDEKNEQAAVID